MSEQLALLAGISERDRILASLAENHAAYLELARTIAREIAALAGRVTIDDVREQIEARGLPMPGAVDIDERVFGCLFRCRDFEAIDQVPTRRHEWAARVGRARSFVTVYRLRSAA